VSHAMQSDRSCLRRVTRSKLDIVMLVIKTKFFFGPNESSENLIEDSLDSGQPGPVSSMQMMAFLVFLTDSVMVIVKNWINFAKEYCTNYEIKHVSEKVSN